MSHEHQTDETPTANVSGGRKGRRLLRIPEAMARLACGKTTFYEYVKQGRLPIVKLGASTRISEEALDRFIESLTSRALAQEIAVGSPHADGKLP